MTHVKSLYSTCEAKNLCSVLNKKLSGPKCRIVATVFISWRFRVPMNRTGMVRRRTTCSKLCQKSLTELVVVCFGKHKRGRSNQRELPPLFNDPAQASSSSQMKTKHDAHKDVQRVMIGKSCLVLDLDSTLITTFGEERDWKYMADHGSRSLVHKTYDLDIDGIMMWGTKRPYLREFLETSFEVFDIVGVWSAGTSEYVREVVREIFPRRPDFIWTRKDCVEHMELLSKVIILQKPLTKLFRSCPDIDPKRTLIVDDYSSVCRQDTLYHIQIPEWRGRFKSLTAVDQSLKQLAEWFETHLPYAEDFKFLSHKGIFS